MTHLQLWTQRTDELHDGAERAIAMLCAEERDEARRFHRAADRNRFAIARALARRALSSCFPVAAAEWRFARDRHGKPFVAWPPTSPPARFSVSHTVGLVACLVSGCAEAAVDVERIEHHADLDEVSRQVLAPAEQRALGHLSGAQWTARFFDYWTLKEAYAKARGLGLGIALQEVSFDLVAGGTPGVRFGALLRDDPAAWVFRHWRMAPEHAIAVAVKLARAQRCEIEPEQSCLRVL